MQKGVIKERGGGGGGAEGWPVWQLVALVRPTHGQCHHHRPNLESRQIWGGRSSFFLIISACRKQLGSDFRQLKP